MRGLHLPTSWAASTLGAIAQWGSGGTPSRSNPSFYGGPIFWFKTGELGPREIFKSEETITPDALNASSAKVFPKGSIALAMYGATIGKVSILGVEATTNQACAVGIPNREVTGTAFLYHYLRSQKEAFVAAGQGGAQPNISQTVVKAWPVPVPPIAEQHRIADKLDTVLTRVDAVNTRLARVTPLLKRFRQSVLAAATSGWLVGAVKQDASKVIPVVLSDSQRGLLPDSWSWRSITELARLESGHTPRKSVPEYWDGGSVPWLSLQDIRAADGHVISETKLKPTMLGIDNSSARLLPAGTVCFCRDISFGYVTIMGREMATSQHFVNWVCGAELNARYLMFALMAARDSLSMSGQGTTVTTMYMPALKVLQLATPPIEIQTEIVRRVESLFAYADRLEARLQTAQTAADRLTPSLLAKAFRGELVPQDPNDEPASELLKRLAASTPVSPTKRGRAKSTKAV